MIPGLPHHVTHRGNNQQPLFADDTHRDQYIAILKERCLRYGLEVCGYCLMTNHVHLAVIPSAQKSLVDAIGYSHRFFAQETNRRHSRSGHLWESRFYSCPLDEAHFIRTLIYIDRNPVRAGIVTLPNEYPWSSADAHMGLPDRAGLVNSESWGRIAATCDWQRLVRQEEDRESLNELRACTVSGTPLGDRAFVGRVMALRQQTLR